LFVYQNKYLAVFICLSEQKQYLDFHKVSRSGIRVEVSKGVTVRVRFVYFLKYFDEKGWDAKTIKVIIQEDIEDDEIHVVICDDMTYSGGKLQHKCEALL
jgi:hypothetical protein